MASEICFLIPKKNSITLNNYLVIKNIDLNRLFDISYKFKWLYFHIISLLIKGYLFEVYHSIVYEFLV